MTDEGFLRFQHAQRALESDGPIDWQWLEENPEVREAVAQLVAAIMALVPLMDADDGDGHVRVGAMLAQLGVAIGTGERPEGV